MFPASLGDQAALPPCGLKARDHFIQPYFIISQSKRWGVPAAQSMAPEPRRATSCFLMPLNPSEEEGNPLIAPTAGRGARGRLPCFPTGKEWEQGGRQRSLLPKKG